MQNQKFERLQRRQLDQMNQPIYIRDLIIRNMQNEMQCALRSSTYSTEARLALHIDFLINTANDEHRRSYYDTLPNGTYQIREGHQNHITRLSTAEFSFYTQQPLTLKKFNNLLSHIAFYAETTEENVHFLLSSFAILDEHHQLHNITIYIEGGRQPNVHLFSKHSAFMNDPNYRSTLFSHQESMHHPTFHTEFVASDNHIISTDSVFEITTKGGARFLQAIDVCYDHVHGHSKEMLYLYITKDAPDTLIPNQIEQCVVSNSVSLFTDNCVSSVLVHVDPKSRLHTNQIERVIEINETTPSYTLHFGSPYTIELLFERPAGQYSPALQKDIATHNQIVLQRKTNPSQQSSALYMTAYPHVFANKIQSMLCFIANELAKNWPSLLPLSVLQECAVFFDIPVEKLLYILNQHSQRLKYLPYVLHVLRPETNEYLLEHGLHLFIKNISAFKEIWFMGNYLNPAQKKILAEHATQMTHLKLARNALPDVIRVLEAYPDEQSHFLKLDIVSPFIHIIISILSLKKSCKRSIEQISLFKLCTHDYRMDNYLMELCAMIETSDLNQLKQANKTLISILVHQEKHTVFRKLFHFFSNQITDSYVEYHRIDHIERAMLAVPVLERHDSSKATLFWQQEANHFSLFISQYKNLYQAIETQYGLYLITGEEKVHFLQMLDNTHTLYNLNALSLILQEKTNSSVVQQTRFNDDDSDDDLPEITGLRL